MRCHPIFGTHSKNKNKYRLKSKAHLRRRPCCFAAFPALRDCLPLSAAAALASAAADLARASLVTAILAVVVRFCRRDARYRARRPRGAVAGCVLEVHELAGGVDLRGARQVGRGALRARQSREGGGARDSP